MSVVDAHGRAMPAGGLAAWLQRVAPSRAFGEVTIALVPDGRSRLLNRTYRGKDLPTDVLSFPAAVGPSEHSGVTPRFLGDIVIARGVAKRQARDAGHAESAEWRVLALHGLLHLIGYDHETDNGRMARVESRLRRHGGLTNGLLERRTR